MTSVNLAYDRAGAPGGSPILLLHGIKNSRERYTRDIVPRLATLGYDVVAVDLRGHGRSAWADSYRPIDYAADCAALIEKLGSRPMTVVGHSMGGVVAIVLASGHPSLVSGLFLEDPALFTSGTGSLQANAAEAREFAQELRTRQSDGTTAEELAREMEAWPSSYPGVATADVSPASAILAKARALLSVDPAAIEDFYAWSIFNDRDTWSNVKCPVTVLRSDPSLGALFRPEHVAALQATVPHAENVVATGEGHSVIARQEGLESYLTALDAFLRAMGDL